MGNDDVRAFSGRRAGEINLQALRRGELGPEDVRISGATLRAQAETAGYPQLAQNLRRAAEVTGLSNEEVFDIYNALRPGRSSYGELTALAARLEARQMPLTAAFIREAAEAYRERGIVC